MEPQYVKREAFFPVDTKESNPNHNLKRDLGKTQPSVSTDDQTALLNGQVDKAKARSAVADYPTHG